jgi:hypothetical protein
MAIREYIIKRQADLFWVVLKERHSKTPSILKQELPPRGSCKPILDLKVAMVARNVASATNCATIRDFLRL